MDERLRISLWMVGGGGFGVVLGGAFGGLTGAFFARSGQSAGTGLGRRIAESFARTAERELSFVEQGTITGAVDGVLFLGILGTLAGALLGASGRATDELLIPAVVGCLLLVGGAAFFGILAYAVTRNGIRAAFYVFGGGLLGSFLVGQFLGANLSPLGTLFGFFVGLTLSFLTRRYTPTFEPPDMDETASHVRSDDGTNIMGSPHPLQDIDAFRKPDPFEEE